MRMKSNGNAIERMNSRRKVADMRKESKKQSWKWIGIFAGVALLTIIGGYLAVPSIRQAEITVWHLFMAKSIGDKVDCILLSVCLFALLISINRTLRKTRLNRK